MTQPDWLDTTAYPFASRFWELPAGRMHYIDEGSGAPLVFVHGIPAWSFAFRTLIKRFSTSYRCIAMDYLGFGLSDKPADWSYAPQELASHIESLIDGLGLQNITLVLHDWGGPLGIAYALKHPTNVQRLVLFNTWLWSADIDMRTSLVARAAASGPSDWMEDRVGSMTRLMPLVFADRSTFAPSTHRHYIEPLRQRSDRVGNRALIREVVQSSGWIDGLWQQRARIAHIPTLILWGLKDKLFTRNDLLRWLRFFRSAQVRAYPVGHFPYEEQADEVGDRIAAFLKQNTP